MKDSDIEIKIKNAFDNTSPNAFASVLSDCGERNTGMMVATENKKNRPWYKSAALAAAALLVVLGGATGLLVYDRNFVVDSTVSLDVNPSLEIQVNKKERVLDVIPLNEDGKLVLGDMDLKGSDLDVSINALIGSMVRNGCISDISNSILVSVENNDLAKGEQLQRKLTDEINTLLQTNTFSGAVLSQTITKDENMQNLAAQYGITQGKAQLIQQIISHDARYTFEDLAPLTINELNLIGQSYLDKIESVGTASDKSYIGEEKAKQIALQNSGVTEADIFGYKVEMDFEHGQMVYELEFSAAGIEYDYEIDAVNGTILKADKDFDDDYVAPNPAPAASTSPAAPAEPAPSSAPAAPAAPAQTTAPANSGNGLIGEEAAKNIAFTNAGVAQSSATALTCRLDWDDGRQVYDVDFHYNGYEYDYEIDAVSGAIRKADKDYDDDYVASSGQQPASSSGSNSGSSSSAPASGQQSGTQLIGESAALNAAFTHAGVAQSGASNVRCHLDRDDGRQIYEIEFRYNGYDYDYEIDALTGAVLKHEKDWDD